VILWLIGIEVDAFPVGEPSGRPDIFQGIVHENMLLIFWKTVSLHFRLEPGVVQTRMRAMNKYIISNCAGYWQSPHTWRISKQGDIPPILSKSMDFGRFELKICTIDYFGKVVEEPAVINLFVEITGVETEGVTQATGRVAVCKVQDLVDIFRVLAFGKLVTDVLDTVVFDMTEESLVTHEDAVNV
jgi:hypothetical protein